MCDCNPVYHNDWEKERDLIWMQTMSRNQFFLFLKSRPKGQQYFAPNCRKMWCCGIKKIAAYHNENKDTFHKITNHTGSYWWKIEYDKNKIAQHFDISHLNVKHVQPDEEDAYQKIHEVFWYFEEIKYRMRDLDEIKSHSPHIDSNDQFVRMLNQDIGIVKGFISEIILESKDNEVLNRIWQEFLNDSSDARNVLKVIEDEKIISKFYQNKDLFYEFPYQNTKAGTSDSTNSRVLNNDTATKAV